MDDTMEERIVSILRKHGAITIKIFGSYARGEAREDSDIDIVVDFKDTKSLLELIGIEQELEDSLGIKVDLLTPSSISPYLRDAIEKEAKVIFG